MTVRKVAATRVYLNASEFYSNHVVELAGHIVTNHYPLIAELPYTEWFGGTIIVQDNHAYHTKKVLTPEEAKTFYASITNDMAML